MTKYHIIDGLIVLRHDSLLLEIIEGRIRGKPTRRRIQMPYDLAKDDSYVALKRAAEDRRTKTEKDVINLLYT